MVLNIYCCFPYTPRGKWHLYMFLIDSRLVSFYAWLNSLTGTVIKSLYIIENSEKLKLIIVWRAARRNEYKRERASGPSLFKCAAETA